MSAGYDRLTFHELGHVKKTMAHIIQHMPMSEKTRRMLVVDDFTTMTRVMKMLAHRIGFEDVDVCHDGCAALQMLKRRDYGFVLCDMEMDPVGGAEFARRARAEEYGRRCIIVLTTASRETMMNAVREGVHLLVDGFILKPFNSDDLRQKLQEISERGSGGSGR